MTSGAALNSRLAPVHQHPRQSRFGAQQRRPRPPTRRPSPYTAKRPHDHCDSPVPDTGELEISRNRPGRTPVRPKALVNRRNAVNNGGHRPLSQRHEQPSRYALPVRPGLAPAPGHRVTREQAYKPRAASMSRGLHKQACPDRFHEVARSSLVHCAKRKRPSGRCDGQDEARAAATGHCRCHERRAQLEASSARSFAAPSAARGLRAAVLTSWPHDDAAAASSRPKSPEAFGFARTARPPSFGLVGVSAEASVDRTCRVAAVGASALRMTPMTSAKMVVERAKQGSDGSVVRILVRLDLEGSAVYSGCREANPRGTSHEPA